ncbi:S-layer homology domain-containing protein [Paenibacillus pasadenensis]|uniref:S-layer homology domain-containing protein n=1 Tax=Paenibacillus pasadenensis TaxID=217090 RepID=UPI0003FFD5D1|nr:S-layer homology domain-containing protein [Paenibacillus pasadenensis]
MKLLKRGLSSLLAFVLVFPALFESGHAVAAELGKSRTTTIQNDYIKVTVDNETGRYGIRTIEGQPIRKQDQNVSLLFRGDDPETSFTTFRIDGTDYIFGNKYKFGSEQSRTTEPTLVEKPNGTKQLEMVWSMKGVSIKQILLLYTDGKDKINSGNVNIRYEVTNGSGAKVEVGSRILLDTMVGGNDGPAFQVGTASKAPLLVERRLTHEPEKIGIPPEDAPLHKLPAYWVMRDKLDLENPQATNVVAYGFNNVAEQNINIVDEMVVGHWNGLANTKWDYEVHPNLDFTRDTNDYGSADSAVAFYWNPDAIDPGRMQSFETIYGLGEIVAPDKVFSIRYVDPIQQLATLPDASGYRDEGVFDIIAEVENLPSFNMEHSRLELEMTLESGLSFVQLDEQGNIKRDGSGKPLVDTVSSKRVEYRKEATPEEAKLGIQPKYKPGDTVTATFKVMAKGRPWPTTRQYMLTARSPETRSKIEGIADESIQAQYESVKTNFILLPPVGQATPTYVYGVSPKELYRTDVKYMTVNLSNIEAYTTGGGGTEPNFDLFLVEKSTRERYRVPVADSVLLQPTDDGLTGDMRITYRGGDKVDEAGSVIEEGLGPELPLGEYEIVIDYKGTAGDDPDLASMYDIASGQTILVTDNDESRIREAGILALYKEVVDLSGIDNGATVGEERLEQLNSLFPGEPFEEGSFLYEAATQYKKTRALIGAASKAVDPEFELSEFADEAALSETPLYNYQIFESEEDLEAFEEQAEEDEIERETLVVVRGMVKQVGSGDDQQIIVDTKTEPAIINGAVAYSGKDLVLVRGKLDILGIKQPEGLPLLDTLFVKGDGTLSVASSGFIFHKGEWTLDFFNGFDKTLGGDGYGIPRAGSGEDEEEDEEEDSQDANKQSATNPEDDSQNGSLKWAVGGVGDRLNPLRQIMLENVYFNKHSLFSAPSFSIDGFGLSLNDFILREGGISFGGSISLKIVNAEINNVIFNDKGFVGIDAKLGFDLNESLGLFGPKEDKKSGEEGPKKPSGSIGVTHYVQKVDGINNTYGLEFEAQLKNMTEVAIEFSLKQVDDGRILPDVIAFGTQLKSPGILITGATYLTAIRGAVRELADTIAGGTAEDPFPLTIQAGVGVRFGMAPAYFFGDIDLTLKRTGIKIEGVMDYSPDANAEKDDRIEMITMALLEAQWVTPWFVRVQAEVDIGGWDIIVGKAGIFVGQNLEKNRTDFEGYIGSKVQIPGSVPVVGGMPLASVFLGVNNDKLWGSVGILFISLGITYYWGGGVEFGTSTDQLPEGLAHLVIEDPERGPRLLVIGSGVQALADSRVAAEQETQAIEYREIGNGMKIVDNGDMTLGLGGITVKNGGRVHEIPLGGVSGNAIIEVEYDSKELPAFTLKDGSGKPYPIKFDNTNTDKTANAFTQVVSAKNTGTDVDSRKAYVIIPAAKAAAGGTWTLTAQAPVETKLLNVPTAPQLSEVGLTADPADENKFAATWKVDNAKPGDTVSLYLAKDAVTDATETLASGDVVRKAGDAGMLIAKDLPAAAGRASIDVRRIELAGGTEDIRGLLRQGSYYVRAELKSENAFATKTSAQRFELKDPMAPGKVSDVAVKPAGNGYFHLSFKPGAVKSGQQAYERSYVVEAFQNGIAYEPFGDVLMTEEELQPYWNAASGKYEGIPIGGWAAVSASDQIDTSGLGGTQLVGEEGKEAPKVSHAGLETGSMYVIGVSASAVPTEADDKNRNPHYADRADTAATLLPLVQKPQLTLGGGPVRTSEPGKTFWTYLTSGTEQTISLHSAQPNVEVEAYVGEEYLGKADMRSEGGISRGSLKLTRFATDGTFAVELRSRNTATGDVSVTMLYLTVDTIAPVLYIDEPATGARTQAGRVRVAGSTTPGDVLTVAGQPVEVEEDGRFGGEVLLPEDAGASAELKFVARDAAGNENSAVVDVTNDGYRAPSAIVLKPIPTLRPGDSVKLQAVLQVADGKDGSGKTRYKEVALTETERERLTLTVDGDSALLAEDGTLTALGAGASLITAEYRVSDGMTLQAMAVAEAKLPQPTSLGALGAEAEAVLGATDKTRVVVTDAGDMTGQQLAYRVYSAGAKLPAFQEDLSSWSLLPADGIVAAKYGDTVVVAKRLSSGKLAMAAKLMPASIWMMMPGGFGFGGGGGAPAGDKPQASVNGAAIEAAWEGKTALIRLDGSVLEGGVAADLTLRSAEAGAEGYRVTVERALADKLAAAGKTLRIELPMASLALGAPQLRGGNNDLVLAFGLNDSGERTLLDAAAAAQGFRLLGGGAGTKLQLGLAPAGWKPAPSATLPLPEGVSSKDVTAVLLRAADGSWTPLPWKPAAGGSAALVRLTGSGSVYYAASTRTFTDVAPLFWAADSIRQASARMLVLGQSADKFAPNAKVTRAEYPTILLRAAGYMNEPAAAVRFGDVPADSWYARTVGIAVGLGLASGKSAERYDPNAALTRLEAMAMAGRLMAIAQPGAQLEEAEIARVLGAFADVKAIPDWARGPVAAAVKAGLIQGIDGSIRPGDPLTRSQAAAIAVRASDWMNS